MQRTLQYLNLFGILVLAALCILQWRINRDLNLKTNEMEKARMEQMARIAEQEKKINGYQSDLDAFRDQLLSATANLKSAESNFTVARLESLQLTAERDQLKQNIAGWSKAVSDRDALLAKANEQINQLASDRNDAVAKFNSLAEKHNQVVDDLNKRTQDFNNLVERYNILAKSASN